MVHWLMVALHTVDEHTTRLLLIALHILDCGLLAALQILGG
jgi:hypothetical protein